MTTLSSIVKNGQQLQLSAGQAAININDLVMIGGPGGEAFPVKLMDYAKTAAAGAILASTSTTYPASGSYSQELTGRLPALTDAYGNIYICANTSASGAEILKYSPAGSLLASAAVGVSVGAMFFLSNGSICMVGASTWNSASSFVGYMIVDTSLNTITAATTTAIAVRQQTVQPSAIPLTGGGFAVVCVNSAGTQILLSTFDNNGVAVLAATNIQTFGGTPGTITTAMAQLSNGNIVAAFKSQTATPATTSFVVVTISGVSVVANTTLDSAAEGGLIDISVLPGYFCIAKFAIGWSGTSAVVAAVYNNAGAIQGGKYTSATYTSQFAVFYPCVKVINDGVSFWVVNGTGTSSIVSFSTAGVSKEFTSVSIMAPAQSGVAYVSVDAVISNGLLLVFANNPSAATSSGGKCFVISLPNTALGVTSIAQVTSFAQGPAANGGAGYPRILSGGDFTAIFVWDNNNSTVYFSIYKTTASAIIGVSQTAVAAGNPGTLINVNEGPGGYPCNTLVGSVGGQSYDHSTATPVGNKGKLFTNGVTMTGM